jgi:hypothetical protein
MKEIFKTKLGSKYHFDIRICNNIQEMHKEIVEYSMQKNIEPDVLGSFCPVRCKSNDCVGRMFLSKTHLTNEIISHELIHATFAVYRAEINKDIYYEDIVVFESSADDAEERFAYLYGRFFEEVMLWINPIKK